MAWGLHPSLATPSVPASRPFAFSEPGLLWEMPGNRKASQQECVEGVNGQGVPGGGRTLREQEAETDGCGGPEEPPWELTSSPGCAVVGTREGRPSRLPWLVPCSHTGYGPGVPPLTLWPGQKAVVPPPPPDCPGPPCPHVRLWESVTLPGSVSALTRRRAAPGCSSRRGPRPQVTVVCSDLEEIAPQCPGVGPEMGRLGIEIREEPPGQRPSGAPSLTRPSLAVTCRPGLRR